MKTLLAVITLSLGPCALTTSAQLHLITGSPSQKTFTGYLSALFRLTSDGAVEKVVDLVNDPGGTDWIAASPDLRKAVLVPKDLGRQPIIVVDFDKAAVVKHCMNRDAQGSVPWLLDTPEKGPVYAQAGGIGNQAQIHAMSLDAAVPCDQSFSSLNPTDAKFVVASGEAGVAGAGGSDWMQVGITKDGTVARAFGQGIAVYFDYQVPRSLFGDLKEPSSMVIANNKQLFAVSAIDFSDPSSFRLLIFRKSDKTWHRMPDVGESTSCERAFGDFVATAAAIRKRPEGTAESAGRSEWRKEWTAVGPSMTALFAGSYAVFPGRLYLYNAATEQNYKINTNQADSEILLVEGGVVYYRASDRLYSATLTDKGLSPGRLLATSDVIRDAHWAFVKH